MTIFWFRRDLRLEDNTALFHALYENEAVLPIFIFDKDILNLLDKDDARVTFIHDQIDLMNEKIAKFNKKIALFNGNPLEISNFKQVDVIRNHSGRNYKITSTLLWEGGFVSLYTICLRFAFSCILFLPRFKFM